MPAGASGKTSRKGVSSKRPPGKGAGAGKTASKGLAREPIQIVKREGENVVVDDLGNVIRSLDEDDTVEDGEVADGADETMDIDKITDTGTPDVTTVKKEAQAESDLVDKLAAGVSVDADMDSIAGLPHVHMDEVEYNEDWDVMHFVSYLTTLDVDMFELTHRSATAGKATCKTRREGVRDGIHSSPGCVLLRTLTTKLNHPHWPQEPLPEAAP
jgi:hypothetical protein